MSMRRGVAVTIVSMLAAGGMVLGQGTPPAAPAAAADLPAAKDVIKKYVAALGGEEKLRSHKSRKMTGTITMQGNAADMTVLAAAPNKRVLKISFQGMEFSQGFDGTVAWQLNPMMGPQVLSGKELEAEKAQSAFYEELEYEKTYSSMETVGTEDFGGAKCHKLKLVNEQGSEVVQFFDVETGLLAGQVEQRETELGAMKVTMTVSNYKEVGGVKVPMKLDAQTDMGGQVVEFKEVEFDAVPDDAFALPPEVKTLVEKPATPGEPDKK